MMGDMVLQSEKMFLGPMIRVMEEMALTLEDMVPTVDGVALTLE